MKLVAKQIRLLDNDEDKELVYGRSTSIVHKDRLGVYEHNGELYKYLISDYHVDYFEKIIKPLEVGIAVEENQ